MKKHIIKPGFEFIFSVSLIAIFGLPVLVFGQTTKDEQITIINGDTTINGKNIKDLSPRERKEAMKDIGNIGSIHMDGDKGKKAEIIIDQQGPGHDEMITEDRPGDVKVMKMHRRGKDSTMTFNYRMNTDPMRKGGPNRMDFRFNGSGSMPMMGFNRKNTESFNYTTTDDNGISTHISYRISEPSGPVAHIPGESEPSQYELLDIKDITLVPEFSEGKTTLAFNLPTKGVATVTFRDSNDNVLWTEKTTGGSFSKTFAIGLNGEYILHVRQGGKIAVKKITKEE